MLSVDGALRVVAECLQFADGEKRRAAAEAATAAIRSKFNEQVMPPHSAAVVGAACARRVSSALLNMNDAAAAAGRQLRLQIVGTAAFVFVTFLLRAVYSTINALAFELQNGATEPSQLFKPKTV